MTDRTLILACDDDAGQLVLEDLPAGPAGEAGLIPVSGVELLFDRADGRLCRVFVDAGLPGSPAVIGERPMAFVISLFGTQAGAAIGRARHGEKIPVLLRVDEARLADMSRLARLDATRVTSPVAQSPWWAVEAAQLALRTGLTERAGAEALRAASALAGATGASLAGVPAAAILAVAELVQHAEPESAKRLRVHAALPRPGQPAVRQSDRSWWAVLPHLSADGGHRLGDSEALQWWLDPQAIPSSVFRHGLWPGADLTVRTGRFGILVEAELVPGADRALLAGCRARLVEPASRTVLARAPLRDRADCTVVTAELDARVPPGAAWVEIVDDESRPVLSAQLRHIRRAMRWADAALIAGRRPPGLDDDRWARLADSAWERCARDWSAAGDADRAYLAAAGRATLSRGVLDARPVSTWAEEIADWPALAEPAFLAETVGW
jgi:hypothetical protein